jgi:hypothetical protein
MDKLQQSKSLLTKLLATENLNVEYRNVATASFNTANRTLILPLWEDMSPELYDLLGGHEVGHALFTPAEGWHDAVVAGIGPGFRTFLNVVEDARIENAIKAKYPGIRKSFSKGYRELIDRDFFGTKHKNPNSFLLIDRINLHFKGGAALGIEFKPEENHFISKIDQVKTWDEVVAVAKELYEYCREELKQQYQEQKEMRKKMREQQLDEFNEDDYDLGEDSDFGEDYSEWDDEDDSDSDSDSDKNESDETESKRTKSNSNDRQQTDNDEDMNGSGDIGFEDDDVPPSLDPVSVTDKNFQEKVQSLSQKKSVNNGKVPSFSEMNTDKLNVDWKKLVGCVVYRNSEYYKTTAFGEFEIKNKNAIAYLVKEFEMRKKASELRRVSLSDTGTIDTNLLHAYKFDDNIFRKIASVPEGKSHGLFIVVDWSGSMSDNMKGTIEQMLVLTMFCRKIGVPFEVYAFSTQYGSYARERGLWLNSIEENSIDFERRFHLLNLLSSRMSNQAYRNMGNDLLMYANCHESEYTFEVAQMRKDLAHDALALGGTPLNATILAMSKMVNNFKINNRLEVVNAVILTDGEDSSSLYTVGGLAGGSRQIGPENYNTVSYVFDKETRKTYKVKNSITEVLLKILKDRTGCNLLGFYILPNRKMHFVNAFARLVPNKLGITESAYVEFKNDKVHTLYDVGYDEYYLIPGGSTLETENDDLNDLLGNDNTQVSTRKLKGAFIKMNQNRLTNRVLLRKFIEQVA